MVTWFAALFYLPRLFVYHSLAQDLVSIERFKVMERKLYYGIAWPGGLITAFSGMAMLHLNPLYIYQNWLRLKLLLILITWVYHFVCGHYLKLFKLDKNAKTHVYFRVFNELPVFSLCFIIILAVYRPELAWLSFT